MRDPVDFFVGYLPVPARQRRFLTLAAVTLVCAIGLAAVLLASRQRDPGPGVWIDDKTAEITGIVYEHPYPMLRTFGEDGSVRTLLIVSEGKLGGAAALAGWNGRAATLRGTILQREGVSLLELNETPSPAQASVTKAKAQAIRSPLAPSPQRTLRGEIIDPKCFAGAMKPGDGKPHKGCAALCLRGGIPPMFTRITNPGVRELYLITDENGERADGELLQALIARVGQQTELHGSTLKIDDVTVLRVDASQFQRDSK